MKSHRHIDFEILLGGIFGILAIAAAIVEMALGSFEATVIASGIKDIASTAVSVMIFIAAVKVFFKREDKSFPAVFEKEMQNIETKYSPLLRQATANGDERREKKLSDLVRYELSTNVEALFDGQVGSYATFFEFNITSPEKIIFHVNKTTFMGRSTDSFDDMRKTITLVMQNTVLRKHEEYKNGFKSTSNGFEIVFDKLLKSKEDAENLTLLIDSLMLMYIEQSAKYKNR